MDCCGLGVVFLADLHLCRRSHNSNYHKSLDFRSFQFKQNDKKALSPDALAHEVQQLRAQAVRNAKKPALAGTACYNGTGAICAGGGQLRFVLDDDDVHRSILCILHLSIAASLSRTAEREGGPEAAADDGLKEFIAAAAAACVASASEGGPDAGLKASDLAALCTRFRKGSGAYRVIAFFEKFVHVFLGLETRCDGDIVAWLRQTVEEDKVLVVPAEKEAAEGEVKRKSGGDGEGQPGAEPVAGALDEAYARDPNVEGEIEGSAQTGFGGQGGILEPTKEEGEGAKKEDVKEEMLDDKGVVATTTGRGRGSRGRGGRRGGRWGGRARGRGRWGHLLPAKKAPDLSAELVEAMAAVVSEAETHICNGVKPAMSAFAFSEPTCVFEPTVVDEDSSSDDAHVSPGPPGARITRSRLSGGERDGATAGERGGRWGRGRGGRGAKKPGAGRGRWPNGPAARRAAGRASADGDEAQDAEGERGGGYTLSGSGFADAPKYQTGADMDDKEVSELIENLTLVHGTDVWHLVHAQSEFAPVQLLADDERGAYLPCLVEAQALAREADAEASAVASGSSNAGAAPVADKADETGVSRAAPGGQEEGGEGGGTDVLGGAGRDEGDGKSGTQAREDGIGGSSRSQKELGTNVMFGNLTCYIFFRLYQKMYERLKMAKDLAREKDERKQRDRDEKELDLTIQQQHQSALAGDKPNVAQGDAEGGDERDVGEKEGGGGEAGGGEEEEDLLMAKAVDDDDGDMAESLEVAKLKGGSGMGGGRWGKKKVGGGRWGKKAVAEEDEPVPDGCSTYQRFMHYLSRLIKGSLDSSDFEEACRITLGTSSYELFTLEWLTTQLRTLAKALVTVEDPETDGAQDVALLALSEYNWAVRDRAAALAAREDSACSDAAAAAAREHALSAGMCAEDADMIGTMAGAAEGTVAEARGLERQCLMAAVEAANAQELAGRAGCYSFYFDARAGELSMSLNLLGPAAAPCPPGVELADPDAADWLGCGAGEVSAPAWGAGRLRDLRALKAISQKLVLLREPPRPRATLSANMPVEQKLAAPSGSTTAPQFAGRKGDDAEAAGSTDGTCNVDRMDVDPVKVEQVEGAGLADGVAVQKEEQAPENAALAAQDSVCKKEDEQSDMAASGAGEAAAADAVAAAAADAAAAAEREWQEHRVARQFQRRALLAQEKAIHQRAMMGTSEWHALPVSLKAAPREFKSIRAMAMAEANPPLTPHGALGYRMSFDPHSTECMYRAQAARRSKACGYDGAVRAAAMDVWVQQRLRDLPVIERSSDASTDLQIAGILGRMPSHGRRGRGRGGRGSAVHWRKRQRAEAAAEDQQNGEEEEAAEASLLANLSSPRDRVAPSSRQAPDDAHALADGGMRTCELCLLFCACTHVHVHICVYARAHVHDASGDDDGDEDAKEEEDKDDDERESAEGRCGSRAEIRTCGERWAGWAGGG